MQMNLLQIILSSNPGGNKVISRNVIREEELP